MKDFFISYNSADRNWAEWIAWQLEEAAYSVVIQAWDFRPGGNFVLDMQKAAAECRRTIAVLSADYLSARFTQPEWAAAFASDPSGEKGILLPVLVRECDLIGLLQQIIYIDLVGLDEDAAQKALLEGVKRGRAKPEIQPSFPGAVKRLIEQQPRFPGSLPPVWNVLFHRNPNFTGRGELLAKLRNTLTGGKTTALTQQAIYGLGGVGKTQLALEYVYRFAGEYDLIWWINSEEPTVLAAEYAELARPLKLPEKDAPEQKLVIQAVRRWLGQNRNWLLIFDNAENAEAIRFYLPQAPTGHVIITSRNPNWRGAADSLEINVLERREAVGFLCKRSGQKDEAAAEALAEALGDLPLALEQAGAYMETTGRTLADYLEIFFQHQQALLERGKPSTDYNDTIATTWELSFRQVENKSKAAVDLVNFFAFLAPDDIPVDLLSKALNKMPESLAKTFADPLYFDDTITVLRNYSLVSGDGKRLSMHRLVQAFVRDHLSKEEKKHWIEVAVSAINEVFPAQAYHNKYWPESIALLPHAQAAVIHGQKDQLLPEESAILLNKIASYLHGRAEYAEAEPLYRKALEIRRAQFGKEHFSIAENLNDLAFLLQDMGKYDEAKTLYHQALKISEVQLGREHPLAATILNNWTVLLRDQGLYSEAESLVRRALKINEAHFGNDDPNVAHSLNILAVILLNQGKYVEAERQVRRALDIYENQFGEDHLNLAAGLNTLAKLLQVQGQHAEAESLIRRSLKIREKHLGQEHPIAAVNLHKLAVVLRDQSRYSEAEQLIRRAIEIREKQLGQNHPYVASSIHILALLLKDQNLYAEAESHFRRAIEIYDAQFDKDHPWKAHCINDLAQLLQAQNRFVESEQLLRQAQEIHEARLRSDRSKTAKSRRND